jgi:hypothetical protein
VQTYRGKQDADMTSHSLASLHLTLTARHAVAIFQARVDGAAWLGHIDTDELVYPAGSASYSMHEILAKVPRKVLNDSHPALWLAHLPPALLNLQQEPASETRPCGV